MAVFELLTHFLGIHVHVNTETINLVRYSLKPTQNIQLSFIYN